ncbi:hypothetical protein [Bacillus paralicheniformis]|uniref:hypothetical protein n=2 Tax=Bacillus paralicheniformis TaxID=1648923 RepID=UPI002E1CD28A|nr:hypothetical protein [Bacillus paralicheniformis]MED1234728.1 hypothetical protein [Bacillus paralicheniformis]
MKSLNVIKGCLIALGGVFMIGYQWVYRPTLGESAVIILFTSGLVFAMLVRDWFYGLILVLISAFAIVLYGYMYLENFKQLLVMLLVSLPMVSAIFLHVAQHDAEK